ncbi:hypothetical protein HRH59_11365 [Rheinheimera sp. YQF-2]|uniref:Uncharacterized protein n=1 Tax=Rheinheimera lutimaris TaxID=2740584 RepID=A0A7Y5EJ96_9GAMM|nr:hypothetical protein [Rheinheimera lutimaris]NRQ43141.1 hypothetical protein [Rheinheimera lutimaris]
MLGTTGHNHAPPPKGLCRVDNANSAYSPLGNWFATIKYNLPLLSYCTKSLLLIICLALLAFSLPASSHWLEDLVTATTKSKSVVSKTQSAIDDFVKLQQFGEKYLAGRRYLYIDNAQLVIDTAGQKHSIPFDAIKQNNFRALMPLFSSSAEVVVPIDNLKYGVIESLAKNLLLRNTPVKVIRQDSSLGQLKLYDAVSKVGLTVEIFPAVLIDVQAIKINMDRVLYRNIGSGKSRVVSIFDKDEVFILPQMDASLGMLHQSTTTLSHAGIIDLVESQKRKAIFLIGHVEDGHIVTRNAEQGITQSIPIAELMVAAKRAESELILLGCETAAIANGSGYISHVNALDIAGALKEALQQESLGMALSSLGIKTGNLFYIPQQINFASDGQIFIEKAYIQGEKLVKKSAATGTTLSPKLYALDSKISQELDSRVIPFLPSAVFTSIVLNLVSIAILIVPTLMFLQANILDVLCDIKTFKKPVRRLIWLMRSLFFLVFFSPFASGLIMLSILAFFAAPMTTLILSPTALIFCIALLRKLYSKPIFPDGFLGTWLKCLTITLVNIPVWVVSTYIPGGQGPFFLNDSPTIYAASLAISAIYYAAVYFLLFHKIERVQKSEYAPLLSRLLLLPLTVLDRLMLGVLKKINCFTEPNPKATENPGAKHAEY